MPDSSELPVDEKKVDAVREVFVTGRFIDAAQALFDDYVDYDEDDPKTLFTRAQIMTGVIMACVDSGSFLGAQDDLYEQEREEAIREQRSMRRTPGRDTLRTSLVVRHPIELRKKGRTDLYNLLGLAWRGRDNDKGVDVVYDATEVGHKGQAMTSIKKRGATGLEEGAFTTSVARAAQGLANRNNEVGSPVGYKYHTALIRNPRTSVIMPVDTFRQQTKEQTPSAALQESMKATVHVPRIRFNVADRLYCDAASIEVLQELCKRRGGHYIVRGRRQQTKPLPYNVKRTPRRVLDLDYDAYERNEEYLFRYHWERGDFQQHPKHPEYFFHVIKDRQVSRTSNVRSDMLLVIEAEQAPDGSWQPDWTDWEANRFYWTNHPIRKPRDAWLVHLAYRLRMGPESVFRNYKQNMSQTGSWDIWVRDTMWVLGMILLALWGVMRANEWELQQQGIVIPRGESVSELRKFIKRLKAQARSVFR